MFTSYPHKAEARSARRDRLRHWLKLGVVCALTLTAGLLLLARLRHSGPLYSAYLRYSKWRYHWRGPDDVGAGGDARAVLIEDPVGVGEDAEANVYISDRADRFIWKIDPAGRATVIAGNGMSGLPAEGMPATESQLGSPEGLVVDRENAVLFVDSADQQVLKIGRDGRLWRIAGTGQKGFGGDGGPARAALFAEPYDVRLDSQGNLYIADFGNHRIRKIDRTGIITTVAGTGVAGFTGDGGPATQACLNGPYGVFLDAADNLLIADSLNHVIRRVGRDGNISTIAGSGQQGYAGDGGPARAARFNTPQSLFADASGRLLIGDEHNHCIRVIERDGTIRTWAGHGHPGFAGDGGRLEEAELNDPENLWVRRDGSILITDGDNGRVRCITRDGLVSTFAGSGVSSTHVAGYEPAFDTRLTFTSQAVPRTR